MNFTEWTYGVECNKTDIVFTTNFQGIQSTAVVCSIAMIAPLMITL
jgi:hypothetical protein